MSNPWLSIPLDDYESHMSLPAVGQAQMIAEQLERALDRWAPTSIAVIERTRDRHAKRLPGLELVCADVQSESLIYDPVDFTYAALLFEYVALLSTLRTLKRNSRLDAVLTAVLQLPHSSVHAVSPSPYKSLGKLATAMTLVAPEKLCHAAEQVGFTIVDSTILELSSGKRFCVQNFRA